MRYVLLLLAACGSPETSMPASECLTNACAGASDCGMGTRCNQLLNPPRCEKLYCGAEGSTCDDGVLCAGNLPCVGGVCFAGAGVGESCDPLANIHCQETLFCVRVAGSCDSKCQIPAPQPAGAGAECASSSECSSGSCVIAGSGCLGACAPPPKPYPPGPYGFGKGSVIGNLSFMGKSDPSADYSTLPLQAITLADYHNDPSVKYLVLLGEAIWCSACSDQQSRVPGWASGYASKQVRFLEVLTDGPHQGSAATESDLDAWARAHNLHVDVAIDPQGALASFSSETASFPLALVVRTSTMTILYASLGEVDLSAELDSL